MWLKEKKVFNDSYSSICLFPSKRSDNRVVTSTLGSLILLQSKTVKVTTIFCVQDEIVCPWQELEIVFRDRFHLIYWNKLYISKLLLWSLEEIFLSMLPFHCEIASYTSEVNLSACFCWVSAESRNLAAIEGLLKVRWSVSLGG